MNQNFSVKDYAKQAKERLSNGYWEDIKRDKIKFIESHYKTGDNVKNIKAMFQKKIERELFGSKDIGKDDEILYQKIVKLLSENEYVLNPIMRLIDHDKYDKMSDVAKQNYIFELSDKYNAMKDRFEKEQKEGLVFVGN